MENNSESCVRSALNLQGRLVSMTAEQVSLFLERQKCLYSIETSTLFSRTTVLTVRSCIQVVVFKYIVGEGLKGRRDLESLSALAATGLEVRWRHFFMEAAIQ